MHGPAAEAWKAIAEVIQSLGIVATGLWAFWRFGRERVHAPQIAFSVDANFHGPSEGQYVAEYVLTFHNKGNTRVQVNKIELLARGLMSGEPLEEWKERAPRLRFGHKFVDDKKVIPENYRYVFFEPGIEQDYRYISKVPADCKFVLVRGQFFYAKGNPHSAERVITVKHSKDLHESACPDHRLPRPRAHRRIRRAHLVSLPRILHRAD
jgi:hypothetical protein